MTLARAHYNENDRHAAAWLRELIADGLIAAGDVDERSIVDVTADDLVGRTRVHLFAGIGGWDYALRLAGWPDDRPVWTGSCPCQPFSSAARGRNTAADMWPHMLRLIEGCRPAVVFGEQVARARAWLDRVCDDVEAIGYAVWSRVLPACAVGEDHARERIFFACHADSYSQSGVPLDAEMARMSRINSDAGRDVRANGVPASVARRGFGNAIVPELAACFIEGFCMSDTNTAREARSNAKEA